MYKTEEVGTKEENGGEPTKLMNNPYMVSELWAGAPPSSSLQRNKTVLQSGAA